MHRYRVGGTIPAGGSTRSLHMMRILLRTQRAADQSIGIGAVGQCIIDVYRPSTGGSMAKCWETRGCDEEMQADCPHPNELQDRCPTKCAFAKCDRPQHEMTTDPELVFDPSVDRCGDDQGRVHVLCLLLAPGPADQERSLSDTYVTLAVRSGINDLSGQACPHGALGLDGGDERGFAHAISDRVLRRLGRAVRSGP